MILTLDAGNMSIPPTQKVCQSWMLLPV